MNILIVTTRYLGDCLLASSLAGPIKARWPDAHVSVLTFTANKAILEGVAEIDEILTVEPRPSKWRQAAQLLGLRRRYDWAVVTQPSTRAMLYGLFGAKKQTAWENAADHRGWWKRALISHQVPRPGGHWLAQAAALLSPLMGETPNVRPLCPDAPLPDDIDRKAASRPYVVFQMCSRYRDKNWTTAGWLEIARDQLARGRNIFLTGGNGELERRSANELVETLGADRVCNVCARLSFGQSARLIRGAQGFIGVDTATSHVAGASGTPTLALFGPTPPSEWGPAPCEGAPEYRNDLPRQSAGNVTVLKDARFLGCAQCSRHRCPKSADPETGFCMTSLAPSSVIEAFNALVVRGG